MPGTDLRQYYNLVKATKDCWRPTSSQKVVVSKLDSSFLQMPLQEPHRNVRFLFDRNLFNKSLTLSITIDLLKLIMCYNQVS